MINTFKKKKCDYYANSYPLPARYPDGMDIEIFNYSTLKKTYYNAILPSEKEHVTPFMFKSKKFNSKKLNISKDLSQYRFCVDYKKDFILFKKIIDHFKNRVYTIDMYDLINFVKKNKNLIKYQKKIKRNSGWDKALKKDEKFR